MLGYQRMLQGDGGLAPDESIRLSDLPTRL